MRMYKYIVSVVLLCAVAAHVSSQQDKVPYYCGFEDYTENRKWTLDRNKNVTLDNYWYIGSAVACDSDSSMYVSADTARTAGYVNSENVVVAYRRFEFPKGRYKLAFDWMAFGQNDGVSGLRVAWIPEDDPDVDKLKSIAGSVFPKIFRDEYWLPISGGKDKTRLQGGGTWQHTMSDIVADGTKGYYLVFVWCNIKQKSMPPGGCIDNIEIATAKCKAPENLKVVKSGTTATVTWDGESDEYEIEYKRFGDKIWKKEQNTASKSVSIYNLDNGVYDLRVRGICNATDTSIWMRFDKILIYEALCIDYIDLKKARCAHGGVGLNEINTIKQLVDNGYNSSQSMHTVHFVPDETDPRTGNKLRTVPKGEVASVRVNSWIPEKSASVSYEYVVDSSVARVLTLKYAIVMENPTNHNKEDQPHFQLQIFNMDTGTEIDPACAGADFYAGYGEGEWQKIMVNEAENTYIVWKDWTTIGINLDKLHNMRIKIQLSFIGCGLGAHWGYGYFTLGCDAGELRGLNCGDTPTTEFIAPDGFNYRWYKPNAPHIVLDTGQVFKLKHPNDTTTYNVDIIYPENEDCFFTLTANATARYPVADADWAIEYGNCTAKLNCTSKSYIVDDKGKRMDEEELETLYWTFDDGQPLAGLSRVFDIPNDGEVHTVRLFAGLCDGLCEDTVEYSVQMPVIKDSTYNVAMKLCLGVEYEFGDTTIVADVDTVYSRKFQSIAGCDSIVELKIEVISVMDTTVSDTICFGDEYIFGEDRLVNTGKYTETFPSSMGCDSVVTLHLTVLDPLEIAIPETASVCADEADFVIGYTHTSGAIDSVVLKFGDKAIDEKFDNRAFAIEDGNIRIAMPDSVLPDYYDMSVTIMNDECGNLEFPVTLQVKYPSGIVEQKWNDVLALLNATHNGNYEFTSYQWYCGDVPIADANSSYLYIGNNQVLDTSTTYSCMLTRLSDGVAVSTCPIKPTVRDAKTDCPTIATVVASGQKIRFPQGVAEGGLVRLYSVSGQLILQHSPEKSGREIYAPSMPGIYVMVLDGREGRVVIKISVTS